MEGFTEREVWLLIDDDDGHVAGVFEVDEDANIAQLILEKDGLRNYHVESNVGYYRDNICP